MIETLDHLPSRIRSRRKALCLTQSELAGERLTKSAISQFEKGETVPSLETLIYIAQRLDCTVGYLVGEGDTPSADPIDVAAHRAGITPEQARRFLRELGK